MFEQSVRTPDGLCGLHENGVLTFRGAPRTQGFFFCSATSEEIFLASFGMTAIFSFFAACEASPGRKRTRKRAEENEIDKSEVHVRKCGGETMLATFAFDVCHDVYRAAREAIDAKIPTLNMESSGKYQWHPDRMPRLAEYVCDFARAGERALGFRSVERKRKGNQAEVEDPGAIGACGGLFRESHSQMAFRASPSDPRFRASRMTMFRVYYLGGADYHAARRHLGIGELTWADWAEEIRRDVGRELTRAGVFPPSKYFRETTAKAS